MRNILADALAHVDFPAQHRDVFDTLFAADSTLTLRPQMAEGAAVSDDGRSWAIKLREGLRFHDGTPVRAIDRAASLKRWAAKDTFGQLLAEAVDDWVATDDRTLTIKLKRPFPMLLFALGKPCVNAPFIMPERLAQTDPGQQVGSGPYRFLPDQFMAGARAGWSKFGWLSAPDDAARQRLGADVQAAAVQGAPTVSLGQFFIRAAM